MQQQEGGKPVEDKRILPCVTEWTIAWSVCLRLRHALHQKTGCQVTSDRCDIHNDASIQGDSAINVEHVCVCVFLSKDLSGGTNSKFIILKKNRWMLSNGLLVYYYQSWHVAVNKLILVIDLFIHACRSPLGKTPPVLFAILFSLHRSHPMYGRKFSNISLQYCYRRNRGYCLLIHKRFSQPLTQPQRKLCLFLVWDQGLSGIMLKRHTKCCSNTVLHHQVTLTVMTI